MTTTMTLTDRAVAELSEFNELIESIQPYGLLTVAADGIGKVEEAHKAAKRLNSAIEKKRKELKAGALEYGRTVDSIAKQLSAAVDKIEGPLGAERERWEEERERERQAKEAEKKAEIQKRIDRCIASGVPVVMEKIELPEDEFLWWFADQKRAADRIAEERRIAHEFEAQQRREREELVAKMAFEREELAKAQAELNAIKAKAESEAKEAERQRLLEKMRPEVDQLFTVLQAMKETAKGFGFTSWWAEEFHAEFWKFETAITEIVWRGKR